MSNRKVVPIYQPDALTLPLANGFVLRVTPFHESPLIALTIHGPGDSDAGGVILRAERARLLASWLTRLADQMEQSPAPIAEA